MNTKREEKTTCGRCGIFYETWKSKGILCDLNISNGAHTFQVEPAIPSGVSGWKQYGKKYGYWDFYKEIYEERNNNK